ncbi:hypothetical protein [Nocardia sp. NBC_00403]|uniref:hypothetical protein n=1 Tax=Nocardia sp. NBC_00403 TaxID=2975990 RepID=UPI003FA597ED
MTALAKAHPGQTVIVGSHGTFISRALVGFGCSGADQAFSAAMPMPAIYRLDFTGHQIHTAGPGL